MKILIVDDDPLVRKLISRVLRGQAEVVEAEDQESGEKIFDNDRFDMALVDVNLGSGDGIELGIRFRDLDPQLIVVIMSGDPANEIRARESGLGEMLLKPFTSGELKSRLF